MFTNSRKTTKSVLLLKKLWKAAQSRLLETTAPTASHQKQNFKKAAIPLQDRRFFVARSFDLSYPLGQMKRRYRPKRSNRDRALAQLRGYWEPQDVSQFEQGINSAVTKTLKQLGLDNRFNEEQVFEAWNEMVDKFVAENARPVSMKRNVLFIQVLHSTVFYELERMRGQILAKMQERFGKENIRDVQFRLG
jgi:hypothetical protein